MRDASTAAPGVSPCTQIVSTVESDARAVDRIDRASRTMEIARLTTARDPRSRRPAHCAARACRLAVGAVGKPLARRAQAARSPAAINSEPGRPNRISERSTDGGRARDGVGQRRVADRHVVERAVGLHVLEPHALRRRPSPPVRRSGTRRNPRPRAASLASRGVRTQRGRESQGARPPPRRAVEPARRSRASRRIAGVKAAGDVGGGDRGHQQPRHGRACTRRRLADVAHSDRCACTVTDSRVILPTFLRA